MESAAIPLKNDPTKIVLVVRVLAGANDVPFHVEGVTYIRTDGATRNVQDPHSKRVGLAIPSEFIALIRKREPAIALRQSLLTDMRNAVFENVAGQHDDIALVPEYVVKPNGDWPLNRFQDLATTTANFTFSGSRFLPGNFTPVVNGVKFKDGYEIEAELHAHRSGLIFHTSYGLEREGHRRHTGPRSLIFNVFVRSNNFGGLLRGPNLSPAKFLR